MKINKILNIGLPRTGTYSLHLAFKILGYKSIHYPQGWELLCPFLNKPIPSQPFPHSNQSNKKFKKIVL